MTFDNHHENNASDITDVITDWMDVSGNAELGLLDLVFFDQLVHQRPQRQSSHR
jgi:hypothetical protein